MKQKPSITLIIPAHNEEKNIGRVLDVVSKVSEIDEIIVVADACNDHTADIAKKFNAKVVERNISDGKGSAMIEGVNYAMGDIIMFCDADLKNLTTDHIKKILKPIVNGEAIMSVGLRDRILGLGAIIPMILPMYAIGGERAMTKDFFNLIPKNKQTRHFGIESVMNYYIKKNKLPVAYPVLKNLRQVIKEKKMGFLKGLVARFQLMGQVWITHWILRINYFKSKRKAYVKKRNKH